MWTQKKSDRTRKRFCEKSKFQGLYNRLKTSLLNDVGKTKD